MTYLVDVNVLSEPTKPQAVARVVEWLLANHADIVVDPIVLGEMWEGILALPDGRRRQNLVNWFQQSPSSLVCLDWTLKTALVWTELRDDVRRRVFTVPVKDTMIAASAKARADRCHAQRG